jgi:nucleoside phosphorylase/CheY-like chemotaxis protein
VRILIVDDQAKKYQRLIEALGALEVDRTDIDIVSCASEARQKLEMNNYQLMVLDLVLPLRPEEYPELQHSIDLILEIVHSGELLKPGFIVGITADREAAEKASPVFKEMLWTLIPFSEDNDDWISQLVNCVSYLRESGQTPRAKHFGVDLVLLCALREPELSQVLSLPWQFGAARPIDETQFVYDGKFRCAGREFSVAAAVAPRMGMVSTAITASKLIDALRPRIIGMTGICAGIEGKAKIGDVILVDQCWDWQSGKYVREVDNSAYFAIAPIQHSPSAAIRAHVEQLRSDKAALAKISTESPDDAPGLTKIHIGPVACGSAVIADANIVTEISRQNRNTCGIEMECYGMFDAANSATKPRPLSFAMKGVCDYADPHKNDKYQRYAAYVSARVTQLLFERFGDRLVDAAG